MSFGMARSIRGGVRVCTPALFNETLDSPIVARVCAEIEDNLEACRRGKLSKEEHDELKAKLKKHLPIFTFHATFPTGRRRNGDAVPSGLSIYDIDHIADPRAKWDEIAPRKEELGILLAHVSPSLEGLRLVFAVPHGMTLAEAQAWMAHQLGDKEYDACVKDYARCSFAVPRGYVLYLSEGLWKEKSQDPPPYLPSVADAPRLLCQPAIAQGRGVDSTATIGETIISDGKSISLPSLAEGQGVGLPVGGLSFPSSYRGIPYATILKALAEELGGEPVEGERNAKVLRMASSLRHICDNNPEWLMEIIPTYGLPAEEWRKTIQNACKEGLKYGSTKVLDKVLERVKRQDPPPYPSQGRGVNTTSSSGQKHFTPSPWGDCELAQQSGSVSDGGRTGEGSSGDGVALPPPLPAKLPPLIELLTRNVPEGMKAAVAHAVFPPLGAHLGGVKFRYIDNVEREATFMCVLLAKMSSGKSAVNKPIELIMKDIVERDALNRKREQEWKASLNTKGANKEKPKRPEGLCIQMLVPDMTNAAFVQRLADAEGKFLYTQMDELELLNNLKTSARGNQVSQIIRLAFDQGLYGQERVGAASVTAMVPIRWNWNASATIERGRQFFRTALTDGTLSRLNFCTIPARRMSEIPVYGTYDAEYEAELKPYIERLNAASGLVECTKAEALARTLLRESAEVVMLTDDEVYEMLSHRANVIAYLKACVLYIAHGYKWSRQIEEFVRWSKEYDLWCKMHFYGKRMQEEVEREVIRTTPGRANMLEMLPDKFTRQQLEEVRVGLGKERDAMHQLAIWKNRGYIVADEATEGCYMKSAKYLAKYRADKM